MINKKSEIEAEIEALRPYLFETENREKSVIVEFRFVLSMIDGKILSYITQIPTSCCPVCGSKPTEMQNVKYIDNGFQPSPGSLIHGISPLHCWIRVLECILHISYRLDFTKWKVTAHYREAYNNRKRIVLRDLFTKFGVKVDQVRAGSSGTSTTGNVCRRIFSNPKLASEALGVDEDLIRRFRNILIAINSERPFNAETISLYCKNTYYKFINLYS